MSCGPSRSTASRSERLGRNAIEQLLLQQTGSATVSPAVVAWLVERPSGNPFFCGELIGALTSGSEPIDLTEADAGSLAELSIPATIEGLVMGRLDRLSPLQQLLVKTAAVIGTEFSPALLEAALPEAGRSDSTVATLELLVGAGILDRVDSDAFAMRQAIVRRIAYESLVSGARRTIHASTAPGCRSTTPTPSRPSTRCSPTTSAAPACSPRP